MPHRLISGPPGLRVVAAALLLLAGCSIHNVDKAPDYWQSRIAPTGEECPDISGSFADSAGSFLYDDIRGEVSFDLGGDPFLYPWQWHRCADCSVAIAWHGAGRSELGVQLLSPAAGEVDKLTLRRDRGEFDCKDGLLLVPFSAVSEIGIAGTLARGTHAYSVAADGSLLRRESLTQYWHSDFVVPGVTTAEHYTRWPAVAPVVTTAPDPSPAAGSIAAAPSGSVQVYRRPKVAASALLVDLDISRGASHAPPVSLGSGGYVSYSATPGTLTVTSPRGLAPPVEVPVVAGAVSYVRATVSLFGNLTLERVDAATAHKEILECSLEREGAIPP